MSSQSFTIKPFKRVKLKSWSTLGWCLASGVLWGAIATLPGSNASVLSNSIGGVLIFLFLTFIPWRSHRKLSDTHSLTVTESALIFQDSAHQATVAFKEVKKVLTKKNDPENPPKIIGMYITSGPYIEFCEYQDTQNLNKLLHEKLGNKAAKKKWSDPSGGAIYNPHTRLYDLARFTSDIASDETSHTL